MAAEIRLNGGVRWDLDLDHRGPGPGDQHAFLWVTVGKSDQLRKIRLSEVQLHALVKGSAEALERLRLLRISTEASS
jgi:hypothetical protein